MAQEGSTTTSSNVPGARGQSRIVAPVILPPRSREDRPPSFTNMYGTNLDRARARMEETDNREAHLRPSPAILRFAAQIARETGAQQSSGYHTKWGFVSVWVLRVTLGVAVLSSTCAITVLIVQKIQSNRDDYPGSINQGVLFWLVISVVFACLIGTTMIILWARNKGYFSNIGARLGLDEVGYVDRVIRDDTLRPSGDGIDLESGLGNRGRGAYAGRAYAELGSEHSLTTFRTREQGPSTPAPVRPPPAHVREANRFPATSLHPIVPEGVVNQSTRQPATTYQPNPLQNPKRGERHLRPDVPQLPVYYKPAEDPFKDPEPRHSRRRNYTDTAKDRTDALLRAQGHDYSRGMTDITAVLNPKASASSLSAERNVRSNVPMDEGHSMNYPKASATATATATASNLGGAKHLHPNVLMNEGQSKHAPKQINAKTSASSLGGAFGAIKGHFTEHHGRSLSDVIKASKAAKRGENDKEAGDDMNAHAQRTRNLDTTQEGAYREIFAKGTRQ